MEVLAAGTLRIGALICSEDLDAAYTHAVARQGLNLLVSAASDAWFGDSADAVQHLALATFRAIETRRDLARATNTGVSALVDALGRVHDGGPLGPCGCQNTETTGHISIRGEAALLEGFASGPYMARFFPYLCLLILIAAGLEATE